MHCVYMLQIQYHSVQGLQFLLQYAMQVVSLYTTLNTCTKAVHSQSPLFNQLL